MTVMIVTPVKRGRFLNKYVLTVITATNTVTTEHWARQTLLYTINAVIDKLDLQTVYDKDDIKWLISGKTGTLRILDESGNRVNKLNDMVRIT